MATLAKTAIVGATGTVGKTVVSALLADASIESVLLISRRTFPDETVKADARVKELILPDFTAEALKAPNVQEALADTQALFITLGAGAPSKGTSADLVLADLELPGALAETAKAAGVAHAALLSSIGANASASSWWGWPGAGGGLYLQTKGKIENKIRELGFASAAVYRPGAILENPNTGAFWNWFFPKIDSVLPQRYQSLTATQIGAAMVAGAKRAIAGTPLPSAVTTVDAEGTALPSREDFAFYEVPHIKAILAASQP